MEHEEYLTAAVPRGERNNWALSDSHAETQWATSRDTVLHGGREGFGSGLACGRVQRARAWCMAGCGPAS